MIAQYSIIQEKFHLVNRFFRFDKVFLHFFAKSGIFGKKALFSLKKETHGCVDRSLIFVGAHIFPLNRPPYHGKE